MAANTAIFESPRDRVRRAEQCIEQFDHVARSFFAAHPDAGFVERDEQTGNLLYKGRINPLPFELRMLAVEVAEHLRSALDQSGYACAVAGGVQQPKRAYFPFANNEHDIQNLVRLKRFKDLPDKVLDYFLACAPFQQRINGSAGNVLLWAVNQIANHTKHAQVLKPAVSIVGANIEQSIGYGAQMNWTPKIDQETGEFTFATVRPGGSLQQSFRPLFDIEFAEVGGIVGAKVVPTLKVMLNIVLEIVVGCESQCRTLGLIP